MSVRARIAFNLPVVVLIVVVATMETDNTSWAVLALVLANFIGYAEGRCVGDRVAPQPTRRLRPPAP